MQALSYRWRRGTQAKSQKEGPKVLRPPQERTREQKLEERCRRLETEVASLKIASPGRERRALTGAKAEAVSLCGPEALLALSTGVLRASRSTY